MSELWVVVRYPCLTEDEGRTFLIKSYNNEEEARKWIEAQEGEYFSPGDYGLMKQV